MHPIWIIWPQVAHMALTMGLLAWLGYARVQAAKTGEVKLPDIALSSEGWPKRVKQIGNNYQSQFELPVLFHLLCVLFYLLGPVPPHIVGLAWTFVFARLVHTAIHVTSNHVIRRFQAFLVGVAIVALLLAGLAVQLVVKA